MILNPEIVNGLQTSTEIFRYFTNNPNCLQIDNRNILIRVVIPRSDEARDKIILATNSQTSIPKSSLRASDIVHRQIEMYFKPKGFFCDRRKNYYKNLGKPVGKIISISFLAQCLISTLLKQPDYARARPSTLLEKDSVYKKLFNSKIDLDVYYITAYIGRNVQFALKRTPDIFRTDKTNILFYTIFMYTAMNVETTNISTLLVKDINTDTLRESDISSCIRTAYDAYKLKGWSDKIAKNKELTETVVAITNRQIVENQTN